MHRTICRVFRGTCRKWRENECPAVSGEEVRKNNKSNKQSEEFVADNYSFTDAVGLTAGLVLAYEFTHRRRGLIIEETPTSFSFFDKLKSKARNSENVKCPFGWPTKAISQPLLSQSVVELNHRNSTGIKRSCEKTSIDLTPFLKDEELLTSDFDGIGHKVNEDDEDIVQFRNDVQFVESYKPYSSLKASTPLTTKHADIDEELSKFNRAGKLTGDLLSVLGAVKFMGNQKIKKQTATEPTWTFGQNMSFDEPEPPLTAIELMEKGAELGSSRALYNIGVAYDRKDESKLAQEYYRKAADLGHPLAMYNSAIFLLREGRLSDGFTLMRTAADNGVTEAQQILSISSTSP